MDCHGLMIPVKVYVGSRKENKQASGAAGIKC